MKSKLKINYCLVRMKYFEKYINFYSYSVILVNLKIKILCDIVFMQVLQISYIGIMRYFLNFFFKPVIFKTYWQNHFGNEDPEY